MSLGRSNRDFDFLVSVFAKEELRKYKLTIISDIYKPSVNVPENVTILSNVIGDATHPYINNCDMMIMPIADGRICSGDTVLLMGMQFKKTILLTKPSTLAEMYIEDGKNGFTEEKDIDAFAKKITYLMENPDVRKEIGEAARESYLEKFTRYRLGQQIGRMS